jgi:NADPH:quinone reductase-like Zn-dependent oxidoreductase
MKAAQINTYGSPSVIEINEIDKPALKEGQVLVEVYAASLNPFDSKLREGYMKEHIPLHFPFTLGGDIAGVITELDDNAGDFAIGDKVYGQAAGVGGNSGALAEFAAVFTKSIAKSPNGLDFNETASLPLVGASAIQALNQHIGLQPGQKIFIHGGAGGIGTIAIQLAKHIGAYVATTATGDAIETVKQLGADEVIDYKTTEFTEMLSGYDAVFDTVGGDDFTKSLAILKKGGIAVSMAGQADEVKAKKLEVSAVHQATKVTNAVLDTLRELVESNVVKPMVGHVFPLDNIQEAFTARETGTTSGKVVVTMK